ncbi:hypothetical protein [Halobellus ruber]|uniref:hypothetical protein n=1 Tax=Halobellus ruber TaxID=2761102 RepID=UPI0016287264|nr:hypothetical protein [Halobellus ruber]
MSSNSQTVAVSRPSPPSSVPVSFGVIIPSPAVVAHSPSGPFDGVTGIAATRAPTLRSALKLVNAPVSTVAGVPPVVVPRVVMHFGRFILEFRVDSNRRSRPAAAGFGHRTLRAAVGRVGIDLIRSIVTNYRSSPTPPGDDR